MSVHTALRDQDLISKFQSGLENERYMLGPDGKIWNTVEYNDAFQSSFKTPWHYINPIPHAHCRWYHDIANLFGFVPDRCLNCWKVVVRPQTLQQLFSLQSLMIEMVEKDPECYCKCGIERREWVYGNYGGYFYTTSKEAVQERYKQVRKLVDEKISPKVPVVPKRYCSEFERAFGPTDQYKRTAEDEHWQRMINEGCHMVDYEDKQPDVAVRKVMREWIKRAWDVGDPTVYIYTDGQPLVRPVVAYYPDNDEGDTEIDRNDG